MQRRLEITAQYDLQCSLLDDKITRSTAQTIANSHSAGLINTICDQGLCVEFFYEPSRKFTHALTLDRLFCSSRHITRLSKEL